MDEEQLRALIPFLLQAQQGGMGGINPMNGQADFNSEVMEVMAGGQEADAEDERLARQRAIVEQLRGNSQNPVDAPKSSGAWAQGLANVANAGMAAYKDRKTNQAQGVADRGRKGLMRNMFAARGGIAPMQSTRGALPMQQPDLSGIMPPKRYNF